MYIHSRINIYIYTSVLKRHVFNFHSYHDYGYSKIDFGNNISDGILVQIKAL